MQGLFQFKSILFYKNTINTMEIDGDKYYLPFSRNMVRSKKLTLIDSVKGSEKFVTGNVKAISISGII